MEGWFPKIVRKAEQKFSFVSFLLLFTTISVTALISSYEETYGSAVFVFFMHYNVLTSISLGASFVFQKNF